MKSIDSFVPDVQPFKRRLRHRRRDLLWRLRTRIRGLKLPEPGVIDSNFPGLAVVAIAILPKYHDWCLSMIDSLRNAGGYQGPVYVVTEDGAPFENVENVRPIVVPFTKGRLVAKSAKQLLAHWISEPNMLYIDADVIIAKPMSPWYESARPLLKDKPLILYTCSMPVAGAYHGGLMLTDRERVKPFFDNWLSAVRSGRYFFDQEALLSLSDKSDIGLFQDEELIFLHQILGDDASEQAHTAPATFVHITNGMINRYEPAEIKQYLSEVCGLQRIPAAFGYSA